MKEADAKEEERVVRYLNAFGIAQVLGEQAPAKKEAPKAVKPKAPAKKDDA